MNLRDAAQQALEALEISARFVYADNKPQCKDAIDALRAALAEPVQEPVAWIHADPDKPGLKFLEWREDAFGYEGEWTKTPLYTAPPQRKPLTEEEIDNLPWNGSPRQFARAIERAHGIVPSDCPDSHQPGCDRCRSPLWASTKCDVCGRKA